MGIRGQTGGVCPFYIPTDTILSRACSLARFLRHSVYDCLYLALAEKENAFMITADRKFYEKVNSSAYANLIAWVEDSPRV